MSLVLGVLALLMFLPRAIGGAMYPNGLMVLLSVILIALLGSGHMAAKKNSSEV